MWILLQEETYATRREPTPEERAIIEEYRETYRGTFGFAATGIHRLPPLGMREPDPDEADLGVPCGVPVLLAPERPLVEGK